MKRLNPKVGDTIRVLPAFGDSYTAKVADLLSTMFTASTTIGGKVEFFYYDRLKGESWEFIT